METQDDPRPMIAFLLKHMLRPRVYPRSPIAGFHDDSANAHANQLIEGLGDRGYAVVKVRPSAPLHSADCGKR